MLSETPLASCVVSMRVTAPGLTSRSVPGGLGGLERGLRHDAVVAEEDVGAGVAGDGVVPGDHVIAVRGMPVGWRAEWR